MKNSLIKDCKKEIITFYILSVAALIAATFCDLKIDILVNNDSNLIANWFAQTGEMPASLLSVFAAAFIAKCVKPKWLQAVAALGTVAAGISFGKWFAERMFKDEFSAEYGIIFGVGTALMILFVLRFITIPDDMRKPFIVISIACLAAMGAGSAILNFMKTQWGRTRFIHLDENYSQFTPWYVINGDTGNHSFPSGHTFSAGMSYCAMLLAFVSEKMRKKKVLLFLTGFSYTSLVALTRIVMGAHYLSDVAAGAILAFTCVVAAMAVSDLVMKYDKKNA